MGEINQELAALRQEVAQLRAQVDATDDWAQGVHVALELALQALLKDHPKASQVHRLLEALDKRYEQLLRDPQLAEPGETAGQHESPKMLNRRLGLLGIWPGVEPQAYARELPVRRQPSEG